MNKNHITEIKVKKFVDRFYNYKILIGGLKFLFYFLCISLIIIIFEQNRYSNSNIRFIQLSIWFLLTLFCFIKWFLIPILQKFNILKKLNILDASYEIGNKVEEVKDILTNAIQLRNNPENQINELGAIQKLDKLKDINFNKAISKKDIKTFLLLLIIPLIFLTSLSYFYPQKISETSKRIILFNKNFEQKPNFVFNILNKDFLVNPQSDYILKFEINGSNIPEDVYLQVEDVLYTIFPQESLYTYKFSNVTSQINFKIKAGKYYSDNYFINVVKFPSLENFTINISYPKYTKLNNQTIKNNGNIRVPEGSILFWNFKTLYSNVLKFYYQDKIEELKKNNDIYTFSKKIKENTEYSIELENFEFKTKEKIKYNIEVIKDAYPQINIELFQGNITDTILTFICKISDDFGFSKLEFIVNDSKTKKIVSNNEISFKKDINIQSVIYKFNIEKFKTIDLFDFSFKISDNDEVNGHKTTNSNIINFNKITSEVIEKIADERTSTSISSFQEGVNNLNEMMDKIKKYKKSRFENNYSIWEIKDKIKDIIEKSQNTFENIEKFNKTDLDEFYSNPDLKEKVEDLLKENQTNDRFKDIIEQLKKEIEKDAVDEKSLEEKLNDLENTNNKLLNNNERMIEMLKQLKVENKFNETIVELKKLNENQKNLENNLDNKSLEEKKEEFLNDQSKLEEDFKKISQKLDEVKKLNEKLKSQFQIADTKKEQTAIEQKMTEIKKEIENNNKEQTKEKMEETKKEIEEMIKKLEDKKNSSSMKVIKANIEELRKLLNSTIYFSKIEEANIEALKKIEENSGSLTKIAEVQKNIEIGTKNIYDELVKLSLKSIHLKTFISNNLSDLIYDVKESIINLQDNKKGIALINLSKTMVALNKVANMLEEALRNIKQDMESSGTGSEDDSSRPKRPQLKPSEEMRQALEDQLKLGKENQDDKGKDPKDGKKQGEKQDEKGDQKGDQKGNKDGDKKENNDNFKGKNSLTKELVEKAEMQAKIRESLNDLYEKLSKDNYEIKNGIADLIKKMEQNEMDFLFNKISEATLQRQKDIQNNLLKYEKALKEQEENFKRDSKEGKQNFIDKKNDQLEKYLEKTKKEVELFQSINPEYNEFYKKIILEYLENIYKNPD